MNITLKHNTLTIQLNPADQIYLVQGTKNELQIGEAVSYATVVTLIATPAQLKSVAANIIGEPSSGTAEPTADMWFLEQMDLIRSYSGTPEATWKNLCYQLEQRLKRR